MGNTGSVFKRCGCTEQGPTGRRQVGSRCPKLRRADGTWNPRHGTWSYRVSVPGAGGKRREVMRGGYATQGEAQAALDTLRGQARRGIVVANKLTVAEYLRGWVDSKGDLRRSTARGYRAHIEFHLIPQLGHLRLEDLRVEHVADALATVTASDATRQRVRATLRTALSDAVHQRLLEVNPAKLVRLPSGRRPKALVWTVERERRWRDANARLARSRVTDPDRAKLEAAAEAPSPVMVWRPDQLGGFLDAAHDDRLYALWHVVAYGGLRRGEVCGLLWSDVDLDGGALYVRHQLVQLGREVVAGPTKSGAGERTVALDAGTVAELRAHRRRQLAERMLWGEAYQDGGLVFCREDGTALRPDLVSDRFRALTAQAGLPPVRLHDLRHGAASLMLAAGVPIKVVQETLGHSSSALTSDTYTSVFSEVASAAAAAAAAMVPRKGREA